MCRKKNEKNEKRKKLEEKNDGGVPSSQELK